jgi:hypothetical protein
MEVELKKFLVFFGSTHLEFRKPELIAIAGKYSFVAGYMYTQS